MMQYALIASLTASMGLGGFAWTQHSRAKTLKHDNAILEAKLTTCSARVQNILEDKESDNEVDNIPDSDLGVVPDHWLLKKTGTSD